MGRSKIAEEKKTEGNELGNRLSKKKENSLTEELKDEKQKKVVLWTSK